MTKEEVFAMEAGRDLDVLVAEEILGIEVEWDYSPLDPNHVLPRLPFHKGESRVAIDSSAHGVENTIYKYSTDISAAWQVVEKMLPPSQIHRCLDDTYWVVFGFNTMIKPHIEAKTAPEAICKAALLAKLEA